MRKLFFILLCILPSFTCAQDFTPASDSYVRAKVLSVNLEGSEEGIQYVQMQILNGEDKGKMIIYENTAISDREDMQLHQGETVIMQRLQRANGEVVFIMNEKYRLRSLWILTVLFFVLGILLGGKTGFTSIVGLAASIGVLLFFVIPRIIAGDDPLMISLIGAVFIACSALYLSHGFNRRTSIALLSTVITLVLSAILAVFFVWFGKLYGLGSEEAMFLQFGSLQQLNLRGLLLGGIIIGALGVLDDITTAQTAAIDELSKANATLGFKELYAAGTSIGREHIASLINTLALAYAGASLPVLLLFSLNTEMPWWVTINSAFLAEEIVRTLVGSCTLLLAVPISTWIAAKSFAYGNHTNVRGGHSHVH